MGLIMRILGLLWMFIGNRDSHVNFEYHLEAAGKVITSNLRPSTSSGSLLKGGKTA